MDTTIASMLDDTRERMRALRADIDGTTDPDTLVRMGHALTCLQDLHRQLSLAWLSVERIDYWLGEPGVNPMAAIVAALGGLD
jgi:hypothetical protein